MAGGWFAGWTGLTALGAGAVSLVIVSIALASGTTSGGVHLESQDLRVTRGEQAVVRVSLSLRGSRRSLSLVEGDPHAASRTLDIPRHRAPRPMVLNFPIDTTSRGAHVLGPFTVVRADPWSIVRRVVCHTEVGTLLVHPRTYPVRPSLIPGDRLVQAESMTRKRGDDQFFALREYTSGDEARNVHWRSSARLGRLVVKQKVVAATDGVLVVLDVDSTSYSAERAFQENYLSQRFEAAVEVAASLCAALAEDAERLHFVTTARGAPAVAVSGLGSQHRVLDLLAVVSAVPPVDTEPEQLSAIARRTQCSSVFVVSSSPSRSLTSSVRMTGSAATSVLVRVAGSGSTVESQDVRVINVMSAADLA